MCDSDQTIEIKARQEHKTRNKQLRNHKRVTKDVEKHTLDEMEKRRPYKEAEGRVLQIIIGGVLLQVPEGHIVQKICEEYAGHDMPRFIIVIEGFALPESEPVHEEDQHHHRQKSCLWLSQED